MQISWEDCARVVEGEIISIVPTKKKRPPFKKKDAILSIETDEGVFAFTAPFDGEFVFFEEQCADGVPGIVAEITEVKFVEPSLKKTKAKARKLNQEEEELNPPIVALRGQEWEAPRAPMAGQLGQNAARNQRAADPNLANIMGPGPNRPEYNNDAQDFFDELNAFL